MYVCMYVCMYVWPIAPPQARDHTYSLTRVYMWVNMCVYVGVSMFDPKPPCEQ